MQRLDNNATFGVSEKVEVLTTIQRYLATTIQRYLATLIVEIHKGIDILREEVFEEFNWKAMYSMLVSTHKIIS